MMDINIDITTTEKSEKEDVSGEKTKTTGMIRNKQQTSNNLTISTAIFCDIQPCYNKLLSQDQTYT